MSAWSEGWNRSFVPTEPHPSRCYESLPRSCVRLSRPAGVLTVMLVAAAVSISLTVFGNLLVILSISHFRKLQTPPNQLLRSLAVCDLLVGVLIMPYSAVRSIQGCWFLGSLFCQIHTSTDIMLGTASIFHLCAIAIDRYLAVCRPLLYPSLITPTSLAAMVATSWLVPALYAFSMIFSGFNLVGSEQFFHDQISCVGGCLVFLSPVASVVSSCFFFFTPALVMVCIYVRIYFVARGQAKSMRCQVLPQSLMHSTKDQTLPSSQAQFTKNKILTRDQAVQPGKDEELSKGQGTSSRKETAAGSQASLAKASYADELQKPDNHRKERRGAGILAVVMGVFLLCWCPFFSCLLLDPFLHYALPPVLMDTLTWLGYLNSTMNPIIYTFLYSWFRKAVRAIVCGKMFLRGS